MITDWISGVARKNATYNALLGVFLLIKRVPPLNLTMLNPVGASSRSWRVLGQEISIGMNAMTARFFADTNVVVYTLDAAPNKRNVAISVMRAHPVISVQVINEFMSVALGKMKLPWHTASRLARVLMKQCEVFDLTVETVRHAINLGERHQLSHWDALIVASALHAGCDTLYSEDLQNGQVFEDSLKVENPFAT